MVQLCRRENGLQYCIGVSEDIVVPETNDSESPPSQFFVSPLICQASSVLAAVHFDNEAIFEAGKVNNRIAKGDLSSELQSCQPAIAQTEP